jgi:hypothetical protein
MWRACWSYRRFQAGVPDPASTDPASIKARPFTPG